MFSSSHLLIEAAARNYYYPPDTSTQNQKLYVYTRFNSRNYAS